MLLGAFCVTPPFKVFVLDICWQHYSEDNVKLREFDTNRKARFAEIQSVNLLSRNIK
jgi:hypothetical protein